ncbi:MAG: 3-deoxy-manno-octulosonate cytidylyltransferase [Candidatus Aminicenantes bacterium]|nr:3-deoxy-manno-octulosonate cytidylyltransferase [Candidatus Aminicenantes bacterium]
MRKAAGIIPARFDSTRFPGKPLAQIAGKPMIQWVYEGCRKSRLLDRILIATDDERIESAAHRFGAEVVLTSPAHQSGTERIAEAAGSLPHPIIINIQGDMPLVSGEMLDALIETLQDETIPVATLAFRSSDPAQFINPNAVKVACDRNGNALYFSRASIPYGAESSFQIHVGIYGFQKFFLQRISSLPTSSLERTERLEQLKILDNGYTIKVIETGEQPLHVDHPEDIQAVEYVLKKQNK